MRAFHRLPPLLLALAATSASAAPLDGGDPWEELVALTVADEPAPVPDAVDPWNGPTVIPRAPPAPAPSSEDPWDDAPLPSTPPSPRTLDAVDPWEAEPAPSLDVGDPWPETPGSIIRPHAG